MKRQTESVKAIPQVNEAEVWSVAVACADPAKRSLCVSQLRPSGTAVSYRWLTGAASLLQLSS